MNLEATSWVAVSLLLSNEDFSKQTQQRMVDEHFWRSSLEFKRRAKELQGDLPGVQFDAVMKEKDL